jgi:hypothetical protein
MPLGTFFFSFLRKTFFFPPALAINYFQLPIANFRLQMPLPIGNWQSAIILLLARRLLLGDSLASWTFASASVCMSSLAAHGKCTTVSQATIATDIHQTLNVHLDTLPKVTFDLTLRFQDAANTAQLIFTQIPHASIEIDARFLEH